MYFKHVFQFDEETGRMEGRQFCHGRTPSEIMSD
jgi:hypothetical protein